MEKRSITTSNYPYNEQKECVKNVSIECLSKLKALGVNEDYLGHIRSLLQGLLEIELNEPITNQSTQKSNCQWQICRIVEPLSHVNSVLSSISELPRESAIDVLEEARKVLLDPNIAVIDILNSLHYSKQEVSK